MGGSKDCSDQTRIKWVVNRDGDVRRFDGKMGGANAEKIGNEVTNQYYTTNFESLFGASFHHKRDVA